jgi:hypothetical protein
MEGPKGNSFTVSDFKIGFGILEGIKKGVFFLHMDDRLYKEKTSVL